jgi:exoribonuclease R
VADTSSDDIITALMSSLTIAQLAHSVSAITSSYRMQYDEVDEVLDAPTARTLLLCIVDAGRDGDALTRIA